MGIADLSCSDTERKIFFTKAITEFQSHSELSVPNMVVSHYQGLPSQ